MSSPKTIKENNVLLIVSMKEVEKELLTQREAGEYRLETISRAINLLDTAAQRLPFLTYAE